MATSEIQITIQYSEYLCASIIITYLRGEPSEKGGITVTVTRTLVFNKSTIWSWVSVATATLHIYVKTIRKYYHVNTKHILSNTSMSLEFCRSPASQARPDFSTCVTRPSG